MKLRFWGVRGSAATPGPSTLKFGGNTSCVELQSPTGDPLFFDCGSGLREAGLALIGRRSQPQHIHLFLTHFHWDHIQGIPFFVPLFDPANRVTIYSSGFTAPLQDALTGLMAAPYFPIGFDTLGAQVTLIELGSNPAHVGDLTIQPFEVNHPQGACAYKIHEGSRSAIYAPDREHGDTRLDRILIDQAQQTNALIIDSQYTPEEYEAHKGWGHSTWLEATRLAREASVEKLVLFHHEPVHNDETLERIEEAAQREFPSTFVAREGWELEV